MRDRGSVPADKDAARDSGEVVALDRLQNPELNFRVRRDLIDRLAGVKPRAPEAFSYRHTRLLHSRYANSLQFPARNDQAAHHTSSVKADEEVRPAIQKSRIANPESRIPATPETGG